MDILTKEESKRIETKNEKNLGVYANRKIEIKKLDRHQVEHFWLIQ